MTGSAFLLLVFVAVAALADWVAVRQGQKVVEYVAKPATLALLIGAAAALDPHDSAIRRWFLVALTLSLVGDVFLMLPERFFIAGLGSFLVAHLGYIVGLNLYGVDAARFLGGIVAAMVAVIVIGRPIVNGVRRSDPKLVGPVVVYMFVISAMVASAIGSGRPLAIIGAVLFYASDALIAANRFLEERSWGRLAIIVTYHLGQVGLVLSLI